MANTRHIDPRKSGKRHSSGSTLASPHRSKLDMGINFLRDGTIAFYCHILSSPCARSPKQDVFERRTYLPLIRVSEAAQRPGIANNDLDEP